MLAPVFNVNALGLSSGNPVYYTGSALASMLRVTYAASGALVSIAAAAVGDIPLRATAFSGQTANVQEWRDSTPAVKAAVTATLGIYSAGTYDENTTTAGTYLGFAGGSPRVMCANGTAAQNFQFDNNGTGFRFLYPGVVALQGYSGANAHFSVPDSVQVGGNESGAMPGRLWVRSGSSSLTVLLSTQDYSGDASVPNLRLDKFSSTNARREVVGIDSRWADSTDASRKGRAVFTVYDTAAREFLRGEASGTAAMLGFYGATAVVKPATTGTTTGFTAGGGTTVTDASTFTGGTGATAYRISDIVLALKQLGLLTA